MCFFFCSRFLIRIKNDEKLNFTPKILYGIFMKSCKRTPPVIFSLCVSCDTRNNGFSFFYVRLTLDGFSFSGFLHQTLSDIEMSFNNFMICRTLRIWFLYFSSFNLLVSIVGEWCRYILIHNVIREKVQTNPK